MLCIAVPDRDALGQASSARRFARKRRECVVTYSERPTGSPQVSRYSAEQRFCKSAVEEDGNTRAGSRVDTDLGRDRDRSRSPRRGRQATRTRPDGDRQVDGSSHIHRFAANNPKPNERTVGRGSQPTRFPHRERSCLARSLARAEPAHRRVAGNKVRPRHGFAETPNHRPIPHSIIAAAPRLD